MGRCMSDQHSALARLAKDIETLRARVDELERRANVVLKDSNRKLATRDGSKAETPEQN